MAIWICPICEAVHDMNDLDEDWAVNGYPECEKEIRGNQHGKHNYRTHDN